MAISEASTHLTRQRATSARKNELAPEAPAAESPGNTAPAEPAAKKELLCTICGLRACWQA